MENAGQQARGGDAGLDAAFQIGVHIVSTQRKHLLVMFLWTAVLVWVGMTVVAGQISAMDEKIDSLAVEVRANRSCQCSALIHGVHGVGDALRVSRENQWPDSSSTPGL